MQAGAQAHLLAARNPTDVAGIDIAAAIGRYVGARVPFKVAKGWECQFDAERALMLGRELHLGAINAAGRYAADAFDTRQVRAIDEAGEAAGDSIDIASVVIVVRPIDREPAQRFPAGAHFKAIHSGFADIACDRRCRRYARREDEELLVGPVDAIERSGDLQGAIKEATLGAEFVRPIAFRVVFELGRVDSFRIGAAGLRALRRREIEVQGIRGLILKDRAWREILEVVRIIAQRTGIRAVIIFKHGIALAFPGVATLERQRELIEEAIVGGRVERIKFVANEFTEIDQSLAVHRGRGRRAKRRISEADIGPVVALVAIIGANDPVQISGFARLQTQILTELPAIL